jgi:hypothetical protein
MVYVTELLIGKDVEPSGHGLREVLGVFQREMKKTTDFIRNIGTRPRSEPGTSQEVLQVRGITS